MKDLKELLNQILKESNLEARDYQVEFLTSEKTQFSTRPFVLAGGTSSGKTEMAILKLEMFYRNPLNSDKRTLIIPASKSILRDNFSDRLEGFPTSFTHETLIDSGDKTRRILSKKGPQVVIGLPQLLDKNLDSIGHFNLVVVDEGHEWYFAKTIATILNLAKPKNQLILTGSPFIFNQKREEFDFFYIPAMELYDSGYISNVKVEIINSSLSIRNTDYGQAFSNLLSTFSTTYDQDNKLIIEVCKSMVKKLNNPLKSAYTFNRLTNNALGIFNLMDKTIIMCRSTTQANNFYSIINNFKGMESRVLLSHSDNDPDSIFFKQFQNDEEIKVLISVDRGRIGFNMNNLYNIVDFTYTQNLSLLVQMLGRLFRKSNDNKQKIYYKVSPQGHSRYFEDIMAAVLCLLNREWYERFNLKNMGDIEIPRIKRKNKKSNQQVSTGGKKPQNKLKMESLEDMGIPLDLDLFSSCVLHKDNDHFSTTSFTTLGESRSKFYDIRRNLVSDEDFLKIYHNGSRLNNVEMSKMLGVHPTTISWYLNKNNLAAWDTIRKSEDEKRILDLYHNGERLTDTQIARRLGFDDKSSSAWITGILRRNGLVSWNVAKAEKIEKNILDLYQNGEFLNNEQIAKEANCKKGVVSSVLKKNNLQAHIIKERDIISKKIIELYHNGERLSNNKIGNLLSISHVSVAQVISKEGLESWDKIKSKEAESRAIDLYHNGERLTDTQIARRLGFDDKSSSAWITGILRRNGLVSWEILNKEDKNSKILELYHNGEKLSTQKIADILGMNQQVVAQFLNKNNLKNWLSETGKSWMSKKVLGTDQKGNIVKEFNSISELYIELSKDGIGKKKFNKSLKDGEPIKGILYKSIK